MSNNKKTSQYNSMTNELKIVLTTECSECTGLKNTVGELHKTIKNDASKIEEFLNNYKNEMDDKYELLNRQLELNKKESSIRIKELEDYVKKSQSDMIELLQPLRIMQLIEAGRKVFYDEFGAEYRMLHPSLVSNKPPSRYITPDDWTHFVTFVSDRKRGGYTTYWNLLEGGEYRQFGNSSATLHLTDKYKIAEFFKTAGNIPRNYSDLFEKIFKTSIQEIFPN